MEVVGQGGGAPRAVSKTCLKSLWPASGLKMTRFRSPITVLVFGFFPLSVC